MTSEKLGPHARSGAGAVQRSECTTDEAPSPRSKYGLRRLVRHTAPAKPPMAEPETATEPEPASSEDPAAGHRTMVTIVRSVDPKEPHTERIGHTGALLRDDGKRRPLLVEFEQPKQQLWFWHTDVAAVHAPGDAVTVVRCVDPKTPACMERIGHTGRLLRDDGKGRPYQVGFEQPDQQLWFWPADLVRSAPRGTKARGYLVPDEHSQKALERLGFDLRAPKSSWDADPATQRDPTYFGGAHISVLGATGGVATLSPGCYQQIHLAANHCRDSSWRLPALRYHEGTHQPQFALEESDQHTRTLRDAATIAVGAGVDGWNEPKQRGFHAGLYSSTLEQRPSRQQVEQMGDVLMKARWGFVLERDNGGDGRNFFLDWSTWEEI